MEVAVGIVVVALADVTDVDIMECVIASIKVVMAGVLTNNNIWMVFPIGVRMVARLIVVPAAHGCYHHVKGTA